MLYGQPPLVGIEYEMNSNHRSQKYKQNLLGLYGSKRTGISPKVAWMTKEDLADAKEWEQVYLDGRNLKETIEFELDRRAYEEHQAMER